jgi:hypothetical protein
MALVGAVLFLGTLVTARWKKKALAPVEEKAQTN